MIATRIDCTDLDAEVAWFRDELGLSIHLVSPADDPARVVLRGSAGAVDLRRSDSDRPVTLVIDGEVACDHTTPGGTVVVVESSGAGPVGAAMPVPANTPSLSVVDDSTGDFGVGRAGMEYRDLLPDRWGGRFIASHIRIADGGDVDDWVHFHRIRFQMIYVAAGWVDVVYEDQGEPFRMHAGDCVVQPPEIRHRVLRSSPGLEVIEIGCPAEHDTIADLVLELPNSTIDHNRDFSGQRFTRHIAAAATSEPWVDPTLNFRDTGLGAATGGLAGVGALSSVGTSSPDAAHAHESVSLVHSGEFVLIVGLSGTATLSFGERAVRLSPRSSIAIPAKVEWAWTDRSTDHEALLVEMPVGAVQQA